MPYGAYVSNQYFPFITISDAHLLLYTILCYADCIGSAFNMKGAMQCPNCRRIEKGQWLYANGSTRSLPELSMEDWIPDEDFYDLSYSEMVTTIQRIPCSSPIVLCSLFKT